MRDFWKSTTAKQQQIGSVNALQKGIKVSFVTPGMKKMGKKVEDFLFLSKLNLQQKPYG